MPTFPRYRGEMPECLSPWKLRHYWLLTYWVFFRPTALHCYFYQADPEVYRLRWWEKLRSSIRIPAYRSLYVMVGVSFFGAIAFGTLALWILLFQWQGHSRGVIGVKLLGNGQALSWSGDRTLRRWDLESGDLLKTFTGHEGPVWDVKLLDDGRALSLSEDNTLRLWDLDSGTLLQTLEGHTNSVSGVALLNDGRALSWSRDRTLILWDFDSRSGKPELIRTLEGHRGTVLGVELLGDGRALSWSNVPYFEVSAGLGWEDPILWDLEKGTPLETFHGHTRYVEGVKLLGDGKVLSWSRDNTLRLWELESGTLLHTFEGHTDWVGGVKLLGDGKALSWSRDRTLKLWDLEEGTLLKTFEGHTIQVGGVELLGDGKALSWSADHTLRLWNLEEGTLLKTFKGHTDWVMGVELLGDGKALSWSRDHTLRLWDLDEGTLLETFEGHTYWVGGVRLLGDGRALSWSEDGTLRPWDLEQGRLWNTNYSKPFFLALAFILAVLSCGAAIIVLVSSSSMLIAISGGGIGTFLSFYLALFLSSGISVMFSSIVNFTATNARIGVIGGDFSIATGPTFIVLMCLIGGSFIRSGFTASGRTSILNFPNLAGFCLVSFLFFDQSLTLAIALSLGTSGLAFYPFQLIQSLRYSASTKTQAAITSHPASTNETITLPLPGIGNLIKRHLAQSQHQGLLFAGELARNPFYRPAVQSSIQPYLHAQTKPLHLLYTLVSREAFNTYISPPIDELGWQNLPTSSQLLIGELGDLPVNGGIGWFTQFSEAAIARFTRFRRDRRKTPLTSFAHLLYRLYDVKKIDSDTFDLAAYRDRYSNLAAYPGGSEIEQSFETYTRYLSCQRLSDIPAQLHSAIALPPSDPAIRPTILAAPDRLHSIGLEVRTFETATSRVNKLAAIARATDSLDTLEREVEAVINPEKHLLLKIIRQWRVFISEAGGQEGRAVDLHPVANPYVAGNPVTGDLFVGRQDILTQLEEHWMQSGICPSVILYGHRRMGKSSILKNLNNRFDRFTTIVDFNMQLEIGITTSNELFYDLALTLHDSLENTDISLEAPIESDFLETSNPQAKLNRYFKQLDRVRDKQRFIITIDEFEIIERKIAEGKLTPDLLDYFRALIQTYPWFILAFAGLHTLGEMTEDYWNPLFGSVTAINVSFLSRAATERLITQPSPDFDIDYDADAIQLIYDLAHGQPYLTQLICQTLVTRFNRQTFEEGIERERRFFTEDVNAIINAPNFYRDGNAYFTGVWSQAETTAPPGQATVLSTLSQGPLPLADLSQRSGLTLEEVTAAIATLENHDVIAQQQDGTYSYTVELMRRWVANFKILQ